VSATDEVTAALAIGLGLLALAFLILMVIAGGDDA
jgi:hypothetical protein